MSAPRFFLTDALPKGEGAVVAPLAAEDLHHARSVLRIAAGEEVELIEPGGGGWRTRVTAVSADCLEVEPLEQLELRFHPRITLVQGVAKGEKMDAIVRQAVEVGAVEIVPVFFERSVVKLDAKKRADRGTRWRRIAKSAAEQSHRDSVPVVHDPATLEEALPIIAAHDGVIVVWEEARGQGLAAGVASWATEPGVRVALVVGPEGGLSATEVARLEELGAVPVTLGATILRTETAAIVALALAVHAFGGLGAHQ
ncbi:MAG TPA: 16S rRNA (uracil(1498)-N(3))-methyltransferase [Coriobacteriia bacterium]|nr:16S rRNA (uracil(1498)-N(3))-methyltransferase [Coriobacteriia bacterium]